MPLSTPYHAGPLRRPDPDVRAGVSAAVAERLIAEGLIPLSEAARLLPPVRGQRASPRTLVRWATEGKDGVRLEAIRLSGPGRWTSRPALARFAAALTAAG